MIHMTIWTLPLVMMMSACGGTDTSHQGATTPAEMADPSSANLEDGDQSDLISAQYKNGITSKNAGDKSGKVHLHGTVANNISGTMILQQTEAQNEAEIAQTELVNGAFDFGKIDVSRGLHILSINDDRNVQIIILNPDEKDVNLTFNSVRLSGQKETTSLENKAWFAHGIKERQFQSELKAARSQLKDAGAFRARIETQIKDIESGFLDQQHALMDAYPDTYFAKLMTWKNPKYPTLKGRYFEDIDPLDNSAIRSMTISDRIQGMMRGFSGGTDSGFLECIDLVKAHFEPNPITLESALYSMLDGFYNTGKETICQYILDNFIFDEDCGAELSDAIRIRAQGIINLRVGNTPPNFVIDKHDGGSVNLMQTCAQNKYVMIMFWASWCHKCEQEVPFVGPMYARNRHKGFEVIGVSMDQQRSSWVKAIEEGGMTWPQVSQLMAWDSPIATDYKVTSTPTYFLLNSDGEIVLKPKRAFEVDDFLNQNL
jgi:peroxiredoxin